MSGQYGEECFFTKLAWADNRIEDAEVTLKLHALLHENLVLPSNHIYHENTELLLRMHPEIAELGLIRVAFDPKYSSFEDYFADGNRARKAGRDLTDYGDFLDRLDIQKTEYSASAPGKILTQIAFDQLTGEDSALAISSRLTTKQQKLAENLLRAEADAGLGIVHYRSLLEVIDTVANDHQSNTMYQFANLARLMAGAASKQCANMVPQENLINWCLASPERENSMVLSDEVLFWEVFLEEIFSATDGLHSLQDLQNFSQASLRRVTYKDLAELRAEDGFHKFTQKFSTIVDRTAKSFEVGEAQTGVANFDDLISMKSSIGKEFQDQIKGEVNLLSGIRMVEALLRVPFQLYGGSLQAIESLISFMALTQANDNDWKELVSRKIHRAERARDFATRHYFGQPVLLDFLDEVIQRAKMNWHI